MERKRLVHIDMLKGFVILCVVLGHVVDGYISGNIWPEHTEALKMVFNAIYSFHMPICFLISGFLFQLAYIDSNGNVKKRKVYTHCLDFAVLYVLFCFLMWLFKLVFSGSVNSGVQITDILMIWYKPMPSYWYLYVLIALYLIFSMDRVQKIDHRIMFGALLAISLLSRFVPSVGFEINRIIYYAFFFYCGMLKRRQDKFMLFHKPVNIILSVISLGLCLVFVVRKTTINTMPVLNTVIAAGISIMLWCIFERLDLCRKTNKILSVICRFFEFVGKYMLEIYVTHCFVSAAVRIILIKSGILNAAICLTVTFILSAAAPIVFSQILKKLGVHAFVFRTVSTCTSLKNKESLCTGKGD